MISMSMKELVPSIFEQMKKKIATMLKATSDQAVIGFKDYFWKSLSTVLNQMETGINLKGQCQADQLEMYNRRDNVKVLEVPETLEQGKSRKPLETTLCKVLSIAGNTVAGIDERDLSMFH